MESGRTRGIRGAPSFGGHRKPDARSRRFPLPAGLKPISAALLLKVLEDALKAGVESHLHLVLLEKSILPVLEKIRFS